VLRGRNVKTAMLRGAGHAAYLDKPKEFVELLLEFLGSVY